MPAIITNLNLYPVKGFRGYPVRRLDLDTVVGVKGDRIIAIRKVPGEVTAHDKKRFYYVCMNTPELAKEVAVFDANLIGAHGYSQISPVYLEKLEMRLRGANDSFILHETDGTYSMHDTKGAYVSVANHATWRKFEEFRGMTVDKERVRANVWIEAEPFVEHTWINKFPGTRILDLGVGQVRGQEALTRCPAVNADPSSGIPDGVADTTFKAFADFMKAYGCDPPTENPNNKSVFGVLMAPQSNFSVEIGDELALPA